MNVKVSVRTQCLPILESSMNPKFDFSESTLSEMLWKSIEKRGIPGASVAVYDGSRTIVLHAGWADVEGRVPVGDDTAFRLGCCVKLFTATAIMRLIERGAFTIDTPMNEVFSRIGLQPAAIFDEIAVRDLLHHTHGIDWADVHERVARPYLQSDGRIDISKLVLQVSDRPLLFAPRHLYSYSSFGYLVLAGIVEGFENVPFFEYWKAALRPLRVEVLGGPAGNEHLRLARTYRIPDGANELQEMRGIDRLIKGSCPAEGGAVAMSAAHLLEFALSHLGLAKRQPHALIGIDTARSMQRTVFSKSYMQEQFAGAALGWRMINEDSYGHAGVGFNHHTIVRIVPSRNVAIVVMANTYPAWEIYSDLFDNPLFQNKLKQTKTAVGEADHETVAKGGAARVSGSYHNDMGRLDVRQCEDHLHVDIHLRFQGILCNMCSSPAKRITANGYRFTSLPSRLNVRDVFWFVEADAMGCPSHIWDGMYIWRRDDGSRKNAEG